LQKGKSLINVLASHKSYARIDGVKLFCGKDEVNENNNVFKTVKTPE